MSDEELKKEFKKIEDSIEFTTIIILFSVLISAAAIVYTICKTIVLK